MAQHLQEVRTSIRQSILVARNNAGLSQKQLAAAVGVNPSTVVRWEREVNPIPPGFDTAVLVARVLEVSLDQLAFGQDSFFERVVSEVLRRADERYAQKAPLESA